jgi:hypothetical protein
VAVVRLPSFLLTGDGRVRVRGVRTVKTTVAAVAAYVAAVPLSDNPRPVLAPLTALLVVQVTLYDSLRTGLRRVVSVVAGVLVAVGLSTWVPLTWWSLGIAVAASLVLGRLLRLGAEVAEVPISAMLVLAVGGAEVAAEGRVVETMIGAVVGVMVGAVVAPPLYVRPATAAVEELARSTAEALRTVSREVREEYDAERTERWLDLARGLGAEILHADRELGKAEASMRLNVRTRRLPHAGASLRSGLEALERASVSLRGVARSLADLARAGGPETVYGEDVRSALSDLLADVGDAVEAYGELVGSETVAPGPREDGRLRDALSAAWEDRHRLADLLRREERMREDQWSMHGALASHIDRLLRDVDSDARAELRQSWPEAPPAPLARPVQAARTRLRRPPSRPRH